MAWFTIDLSQRRAVAAPPVVMLWVVGLVLFDLFTVTVRRLLRRRSPVAADRAHIHHLLQRCGLSCRATWAVLVAANVPAELGAPADPLRTPEGLLPAWPVLAWYALIDLAPGAFPVPLFILAGALVILAWPCFARRLAERMPAVHAGMGILALLAGVALAILGLKK